MSLKAWATPLTIGGFVISAVTGVVIFFHINIGLVRPAHEWLSWLMILGVVFHLALHWKGFKGYFRKGLALGIILLCLVLTGASMVPMAKPQGGGGRGAIFQAVGLLTQAPLSTLAPVLGQSLDDVTATLKKSGIEVTSPAQNLDGLARQQGKRGTDLLVLLMPKGKGR